MELMLERLRETRKRTMSEEEIPAETLAAFLDGRLDAEEHARVQERLAADPAARAEMLAAARLVEQASALRPQTARWRARASLAAAAAALIAIGVLSRNERSAPSTTPVATERRSDAEDGGRIALLTPSERQPVEPASVLFSWGAVGNASYRLTVTDSLGGTLWTTTTASPRVRLPASVRLEPSRRYYWYVDALLLDGSSLTSGPRAFGTSGR